MQYEEIFKALEEKQIRYLVVGGVAVFLHGVPRMTIDLDLMVDLNDTNTTRLVNLLTQLGFSPRIPVKPMDYVDSEKRKDWAENKNMKVFTWVHPESHYEIDTFIVNPLDFESVFDHRLVIHQKGFDISVIRIEDLITLKKLGGRNQDMADIDSLQKVQKNE